MMFFYAIAMGTFYLLFCSYMNYIMEKREIELLNKLITEKSGYSYLVEGYYYYPDTEKIIPNKHLNSILWPKK